MADGYVHRNWWERNRVRALGSLIALFLVLSGVATASWWAGRCAHGVSRVGNQCVGITDGSFLFDKRYREVERKIKAENERVAKSGKPYVSIVYFAPMTLDQDQDTITVDSTNNALEGAYLAQKRANDNLGHLHGNEPLVRILLANPGSQSMHAERVVRQISELRQQEHVVAVAGLGQSNRGARAAITSLTRMRMPIVGATVTADTFTDAVDGSRSWFVRAGPTNTAQIRAVLDQLGTTRHTVLIRDDNQRDPFATNVSSAFRAEYVRRGLELTEQAYDSSLDSRNFSSIATNVCQSKADTIFFAGRYHDLQDLLEALRVRPCAPTQPLRVLTLDSVTNIAGIDNVQKRLSDNMSLTYTQLATPLAWSARPELFDTTAVQDFRDLLRREFDREPGDEEAAIMSYDAVGIAVIGARKAHEQNPQGTVDPGDVFQQFYAMNSASMIAGASGWISLDDRGDPQRKALAVFELTSHDRRPGPPEVVSSPGPVLTYPAN